MSNSLVARYRKRFEALSNRVVGLSDDFLLHCFVSGLKDEIRYMFKLLRPNSLIEAIGLARTQEAHLATRARPSSNSLLPHRVQASTSTTPGPSNTSSQLIAASQVKTISYDAMKERRDKGLCYYCDEKFRPGHKCKTQTLFMLESQPLVDEKDMDCSNDSPSQEGTVPEISIHAMAGAHTPQTMRVTGLLYNKPMSVLIDTGSTHNFLDPQIAKKTGLQVDNAAKFNVMVANGDTLSSTGRSKNTSLSIQGIPITVDFYVLPLGGCDAVLGAHWLQTLGPILWDFNKMWMKFTLSGNHHQILGEPSKAWT
ncbi:hypothetical protein Pint_24659 [Pistacia integerrima]|uniref:Uncharacterized protein n=1 Tax=Pistacia integerrima TaxID=434235 RepID=A0ACC0YGT7_9ROSI|nr:hypothetical protein Pint_24659 [Pistacia integerrima]